jgi:O-antigen/teichoic acid export membrane protein
MYFGFNVEGFAYVYLISGIVVLVYNLIISTWKFVKPKIEIDLKFWKELLKESLSFALMGVFINIYMWVDSIMLSYMKGNEVVGWYSASYKLVYALTFLPYIYFSTIYPILSRMHLRSKDTLKFMYERSLKYFAVIGVFIGVVTTLFAKDIILLIYGQDYEASIPALKILIWAVMFSFLAHGVGFTLNSINKQQIYTKSTGISAILNVILNIFAIQYFSYIGASLTTVFTEGFAFFIMFFYLMNYFKESLNEYKWFLKLMFLVALTILPYFGLCVIVKNTIFLGVLVSIVYVVGCMIFGIFDSIDYRLLKSILKRQK